MAKTEVIIANAVRTPIGTYNGTLKDIPAVELGAIVVREVMLRSGLRKEVVDSVLMGNVVQAGNKMNPSRQAALDGGLPVTVPAMTINRVCGSGAQAIITASHRSWLARVRSSSRAEWRIWIGRRT